MVFFFQILNTIDQHLSKLFNSPIPASSYKNQHNISSISMEEVHTLLQQLRDKLDKQDYKVVLQILNISQHLFQTLSFSRPF